MTERLVQYAVVDNAEADVGPAAPGFRATWHSKDGLKEKLLSRKTVPLNSDLYFWDGVLWLEWDDETELPGSDQDPLRVKVVRESAGVLHSLLGGICAPVSAIYCAGTCVSGEALLP